jgi:predicted CopG family antitoxin
LVATCSSKRTDKSVDDEARERLDEMRRDERREHDRCLSDHLVRLTEQHRRNFKIKNRAPEVMLHEDGTRRAES